MKLSKLAVIVTLTAGLTAGMANANPVYTPANNIVPMQLTQAPGYHRMMLGDFEITALYDGAWIATAEMFSQGSTKLSKADFERLVGQSFSPRTKNGGVDTAIIGYLVNTGKNLILIDAGKGDVQEDYFLYQDGYLLKSLEAAGYKAEQIDIFIPTHLHSDHIGGIATNGKMHFPNATLYLAKEETRFWLDKPLAEIDDNVKRLVLEARGQIEPYAQAGKVKFYNAGDEILAGMKSLPTFGHTAGHVALELSSKGQAMIMWGDVFHNHALQMPHPDISIAFDSDANTARKTRLDLMQNIAERGVWVAGAHLPFPGLGHLRADGKGGYDWIPIEYQLINGK